MFVLCGNGPRFGKCLPLFRDSAASDYLRLPTKTASRLRIRSTNFTLHPEVKDIGNTAGPLDQQSTELRTLRLAMTRRQSTVSSRSTRPSPRKRLPDRSKGSGIIASSRGRTMVLDRKRLESCSCECYGVVQREYVRLLGEVRHGNVPPSRYPKTNPVNLRPPISGPVELQRRSNHPTIASPPMFATATTDLRKLNEFLQFSISIGHGSALSSAMA